MQKNLTANEVGILLLSFWIKWS